jgi:hypothetical protein
MIKLYNNVKNTFMQITSFIIDLFNQGINALLIFQIKLLILQIILLIFEF